jgi:hypothetical protein
MKLAVFVGLGCCVGLRFGSSREAGGEASDQACRKGEGTTGAVGLAGVRKRELEETVVCLAGVALPRGVVGEAVRGNGSIEGADDSTAAGREVEGVVSSTLRRLCSVSPAPLVSFITNRSDFDGEAPNAGEAYLFRGRACLALPAPSHR